MLRIGIIGCGAIGTALAREIEEKFSQKARVVGINDVDTDAALNLISFLKRKPQFISMDELIQQSDLIIEAACAAVSAEVAIKTIFAGKDVLIMSVGGLIDREDVFLAAQKKGRRIYIPSGAICGLDGVAAASMGNIKKLTLTTSKPVKSFEGAPYIQKHAIDLDDITKETVLFEGSAGEAIKGFPQNINVAATLSLFGVAQDKFRVKIIASPNFKTNIHRIELEGDFGKITTEANNLPSPSNPKTSYLAILSALATIKNILDCVKIGT